MPELDDLEFEPDEEKAPATVAERIAALRFAAEDGHAESMFLLGVAYAQGHGVEKNQTEAARWFHEASRAGHSRAKVSLGYLYSKGHGVRLDVILAFLFLSEASTAGDVLAPDLLTKLRRQMSPSQIKEATRRTKGRRIG